MYFMCCSMRTAAKRKNGIVPIMGRVTINSTVVQFSCKQAIPKKLWDAKENEAKRKNKEAREINLALDTLSYKSIIKSVIFECYITFFCTFVISMLVERSSRYRLIT